MSGANIEERFNRKCPSCGTQFTLEAEGVAPEVLDKLMKLSWGCNTCAELERKIQSAKERIYQQQDRLAKESDSQARDRIKSMIAGQQTDLRFLAKKLHDFKSEVRLKEKVAERRSESDDPF